MYRQIQLLRLTQRPALGANVDRVLIDSTGLPHDLSPHRPSDGGQFALLSLM